MSKEQYDILVQLIGKDLADKVKKDYKKYKKESNNKK